jgi:hypothetical protein
MLQNIFASVKSCRAYIYIQIAGNSIRLEDGHTQKKEGVLTVRKAGTILESIGYGFS